MSLNLVAHKVLTIVQRREWAEFVGFETRNKYEIQDAEGRPLGFAAEQQKGLFGFLLRQFLGHWRSFDLHIFDLQRKSLFVAHHPFRWIFQRLELEDSGGRFIGALQQRFAILSKKFDVQDSRGKVLMEVRSPLWRIWTFPFVKNGKDAANVSKKWSGIFNEAFTDKDRFRVEFTIPTLTETERSLVLAAAIFIDLQYFENKAD